MREQILTDLRGDPEEERIILNIRDQRQFFSASDDANKPHIGQFAGMKPAKVLQDMREVLGESNLNLDAFLPGDDEEEDDIGSGKPRLSNATKQIVAAVYDRRAQLLNTSGGPSPKTGGLPVTVYNSVTLVHATTNEFLTHFWLAFLSGDERRAGDIVKLVNSLKNSKDRMEAIAVKADEEREVEKQKKKKEAQEEYKRTGIKPKRKSTEVGGGRKVVEELLGPTVIAVDKALNKYQIALNEAGKPKTTS